MGIIMQGQEKLDKPKTNQILLVIRMTLFLLTSRVISMEGNKQSRHHLHL